jgi:hypothetical protein
MQRRGSSRDAAEPAADSGDDDTRSVLQARLRLVFTVLAGVALFYAASHLAALLLTGSTSSPPLAGRISTWVIGVGNALLALRCGRGRRSLTELHTLDATATAVTCWLLAALLSHVGPANEASISIQLSVTYVLMARAVLLPSSGRRTLSVGALALIPAGLVGTWVRMGPLELPATAGDWLMNGWIVFRNLVVTAFLATLTSQVIYGLRKQVQTSARIGQYVLREKLGEGGMGVVYRATHALLRRDTAVKLLLPNRVGAVELARFEREVKLTAQLTHPNTVAIFDYGRTPDGVFYYAMEYLDGGDLEQLVSYAGALPPARVIWILEQVCRALSEAHALGLIHRDVKPGNVLVCERGREGDVAKIVDFGLVKDLNASDESGLTHDQSLTGTPLYLAPEAITAPEGLDARSDLYSLGALAYFLLVGRPPFTARSIIEICAAHLHQPASAPSEERPGISPELDAAILRCLAKPPAARFQAAAELRTALLSDGSAGAWNAESASAWWHEHRARFRAHCEAGRQSRGSDHVSGTDNTVRIRVDLAGRDNPKTPPRSMTKTDVRT